MFYLHCLAKLQGALYLLIFYIKFQKKKDFYIRLLAFLKFIIKYFRKNNIFCYILYYNYFYIHETNIIKNY